MKVKDVINEIFGKTDPRTGTRIFSLDPNDPRVLAQLKKLQTSAGEVTSTPTTAKPAPKAQASTSPWTTTPSGVQISPATSAHPTTARYNKQVYRLADNGQWFDVRDKPVTITMATILNQALEQT